MKTKNEVSDDLAALIIFIRNPELGKVKTRLAKDLGDQQALDIYKILLSYTRSVATSVDVTRYLFYHEEIKEDQWSTNLFEKALQETGDLGTKMKSSFQHVLSKHSKAIIIGSDCTQLTKEIINDAIAALDQDDIVIGPTHDGGYYLIGMKEVHDALFDDMTWSIASVYDETISRINQLQLTYFSLPRLSDIDHAEDWEKYGI